MTMVAGSGTAARVPVNVPSSRTPSIVPSVLAVMVITSVFSSWFRKDEPAGTEKIALSPSQFSLVPTFAIELVTPI